MRRAGVLLAFLVVGGLLLIAVLRRPGESPASPPDGASGLVWPAGTYRLSFASTSTVVPMVELGGGTRARDEAIRSVVNLEADVSVEPRELDSSGAVQLALRFERCRAGRFELAGTVHFEGSDGCGETLVGPMLLVDLSPEGAIERLHEPEEAPELFGYLAGYVMSAIQFTYWPDQERWTAEEPNLLGTAMSHYTQEGEGLRRVRNRYRSLDATDSLRTAVESEVSALHRLSFGARYGLKRLVGAETVRARADGVQVLESISRIDFSRIANPTGFAKDFDPDRFTTRGLREARDSPELRRRLLEQQADGLTATQLISTLSEYAFTGTLPDHNRFLWRAYGLLLLEPDLVWELRPIFEQGNSVARQMVLDLLASVGHPEAQSLMRELLASPRTQDDPRFEQLYQRLGFIDEPEPETVAQVETRYREARDAGDDDARFASAYTLGALARRTDEVSAAPLREELTRDLMGASDPVETQHLLKALGNAGHADAIATLLLFADHEDADVRTVVAGGLGRTATESGREGLLTFLSDPDRLVQKQAIRNLRHHALEARDFQDIAELVSAGRIHQANMRPLMVLAKHFRALERDGTSLLLRAMLDYGIEDNQVSSATRLLLQW